MSKLTKSYFSLNHSHFIFMQSSHLIIITSNFAVLCGDNGFFESGEIKSPNYPNSYPNNAECTWVITAPKNYTVNLRFQSSFSVNNALDTKYANFQQKTSLDTRNVSNVSIFM